MQSANKHSVLLLLTVSVCQVKRSKLPRWGLGNHSTLAVTFRKQRMFSCLSDVMRALLELLLERCGFDGVSLVLSVTETDAGCCFGVEEGRPCWESWVQWELCRDPLCSLR